MDATFDGINVYDMQAYEGANILGQREYAQYDQHCPLMGPGLNYYKVNCVARSRDKTHQRTCKGFPACKGAARAKHNDEMAALVTERIHNWRKGGKG